MLVILTRLLGRAPARAKKKCVNFLNRLILN